MSGIEERADEEMAAFDAAHPVPTKRGKPRTKSNGHPPNGHQFEGNGAAPQISWLELGLAVDSRSMPIPNIANVKLCLTQHPDLIGRIWYDDFHHRLFSTLFSSDGETHEWADHHDTRLTAWLQAELGLQKLGIDAVKKAVMDCGRTMPRHELKEWLERLEWDGTERLPTFLADTYGCEQNDYTAAVGRCWLVSMVARAYRPGCQVDTMVVLEGAQGIRKSSSLAILGGKWYASLPEAFGSRDFLMSIDGVWLAEIPDMSGFRGRDIQHVKAIITTRSDRYRRSYAYHAETYPRQNVFTATANGSDWNQDPTGARRFLPVACTEVNIDYLTENREQLFAEAITRFNRGESWWDVPADLAAAEQEERREEDPWLEPFQNWTAHNETVMVLNMDYVFEFIIPIPIERRDMRSMKRVAVILKQLGFEHGHGRINGKFTKCWRKLDNSLQSTGITSIEGYQEKLV